MINRGIISIQWVQTVIDLPAVPHSIVIGVVVVW